jgi:hypothetical protein
MALIQIESNLPTKVNSRQLQAEIAAALNLSIADVALELVLGGLRVVRSTPAGTTEESFPPFIKVTVPDGVTLDGIEAIVVAHAPVTNDEEDVAAEQARELKAKLAVLATDPEMIALIKAAANS